MRQPSGQPAASQNLNLDMNTVPKPLMIPANQSVFNTVKQLVDAGQQAFTAMTPDRKWVCVQF